VVVGHSMGGAIAVHLVLSLAAQGFHVAGLFVLDVVEGTAIESLPHMVRVLASRPTSFVNVERGVAWALEHRLTRNPEAARVSLPGMLRAVENVKGVQVKVVQDIHHDHDHDENEENDDEDDDDGVRRDDDDDRPRPVGTGGIGLGLGLGLGMVHGSGDHDASGRANPYPNPNPNPKVVEPGDDHTVMWRVPLMRSRKYWQGWYEGLSGAFLRTPCPRVLMLAGTDRLDKELLVGHMAGKFQLVVVQEAGHAIQVSRRSDTSVRHVETTSLTD
jgi:pimeloyl-ACP methyl ester carboxylesterase